MSLPEKLIVFPGRTFSGHNHDYSMLKQEFPPELDWFADLHVRVDLGYLGIPADYRSDRIEIPTKKPRKSKKNPNPQLSDAQKGLDHGVGHPSCLFSGPKRLTIRYIGYSRILAAILSGRKWPTR